MRHEEKLQYVMRKYHRGKAANADYLQFSLPEVEVLFEELANQDEEIQQLGETAHLLLQTVRKTHSSFQAIHEGTAGVIDQIEQVRDKVGEMPYWKDKAAEVIGEDGLAAVIMLAKVVDEGRKAGLNSDQIREKVRGVAAENGITVEEGYKVGEHCEDCDDREECEAYQERLQ